MDVRFVTPSLAALDALKVEALCVPLFCDERPLAGVGGLVDWRLCGALSNLLLAETMVGRPRERLMMPGRPRIPCERLILIGAGERGGFDVGRFRDVCRDQVETLRDLQLRGAALALPGRVWEMVDPEVAIEEFLQVCRQVSHSLDEIILLDSSHAQRVMQPLVDRERRRAMAELDS